MDARMDEEARRCGYVNINGPSPIKVPDWAPGRLGNYYLYFAHHKGDYIRLAFADDLAGPWRIHGPGVLALQDSHFAPEAPPPASALAAAAGLWRTYPPAVAWAVTRVGIDALQALARREREGTAGAAETRPHIASPEVVVDEDRREFRMYYHGMLADTNQMTRCALSPDGLHFTARPELLCGPYLRVFRFRGLWHGVWMPGLFCRSRDGLANFETRPRLLFGTEMRHSALLLRGETLHVFFSRVGDAPERILHSAVDLGPEDWNRWEPTPPVEVLRPEEEWEGAGLPLEPSIRGEITRPANQLRDPAVFADGGRLYLLYSCAGEQALAIAELVKG
jgi:hypothetical protein